MLKVKRLEMSNRCEIENQRFKHHSQNWLMSPMPECGEPYFNNDSIIGHIYK